jgi:hypothetical protein
MCPTPPVSFLNELARDEAVPEPVRALATDYVKQPRLQRAVKGATSAVPPPASASNDFRCTIYSMNNTVFPKFIAEEWNQRAGKGEKDDYEEKDIRKVMSGKSLRHILRLNSSPVRQQIIDTILSWYLQRASST